MPQNTKRVCEDLGGVDMSVVDDAEPWQKGNKAANVLKHKGNDDAIRYHVANDRKRVQGFCSVES